MVGEERGSVTIPKSDCGTFIAGQIGPEIWTSLPHGDQYPKHGVVIWYEDKELAKRACEALFADAGPPIRVKTEEP